ncbi:nucleoside phosphorylase [Candidatus Leptofilum sp.]|uniref:nucleoside phosphorylase n=1 Tax=Candidatus Leptofilum sp. TaxID=3241576 RepID=UPI003B5AD127
MKRESFPILEFDPDTSTFIDPQKLLKPSGVARRCVLCFFQDVLQDLVAAGTLSVVYKLGSEIGSNPVYEMEVEGERIAVLHPGVGAPLAGAFLEELIALGCRNFIACGGCGVLDREINLGHVVVPATAVRDEGTSYHYLPPSREVAAHPNAVQAIEQTLQAHHLPYIVGKTWTTDAIYRETPTRIARRREEGCHVVEMEAAAFFAVAQFRGVRFGQLLYGGDDLTGDAWDGRNWQKESSTRARLFQLAVEACLLL